MKFQDLYIIVSDNLIVGGIEISNKYIVDCGITEDIDDALLFDDVKQAYHIMAFLNSVGGDSIFRIIKVGDYLDRIEEGRAGSMREDDRP